MYNKDLAVCLWVRVALDLPHLVPNVNNRSVVNWHKAWSPEPWLVACYDVSQKINVEPRHDERRIGTKKVHREHKSPLTIDWRGFILWLEREEGAREAIDSAFRLGGEASAQEFVCCLYKRFRIALHKAYAAKQLLHRHATRQRRMSGSGIEFKRPSDEDFLKEAEPPARYFRHRSKIE